MIQQGNENTPTSSLLKQCIENANGHLSSGSCDVCSANAHIVASRDEVGKEGRDNEDGEEEGGGGDRLPHAEKPLGLQQILQLCFLKRSN